MRILGDIGDGGPIGFLSACGQVRFERRLSQRHFLPTDVAPLERVALRAYEQAGAQLEALSESVTGRPNPAVWLAQLAIRAPLTGAEQLDLARAQCEASRAFLERNSLFTLPAQWS